MSSAATQKRVLLAEDDPIVRRLTVTLLSNAGFAVVAVANGKLALERLDEEPFDLIVSDASMPELGGLELLEQLRASGVRTPFVLMSGYTDGRFDEGPLKGTVHLAKPFGNGALLQALKAALAQVD